MDRDPVADAGHLARQRFPHALWAALTGSVVTTKRTDGSDLDIVVLLADGHPDVPYRHSIYFRDWPVELFVHDHNSLNHYLAKDLLDRRPVMHRMLAHGVTLIETTGSLATLRADCVAVLAEGPPPLPQADLVLARYRLTSLLDDLQHSRDPGETLVVTTSVWLAIAELACDVRRRWRGSGKWIARELGEADPAFATQWLTAHANQHAIRLLAAEVRDEAGGPPFAGFRLAGERTS